MTISNKIIEQWVDIDGLPLENGKLYFGSQNQNPETNPVSIFYDEALTQPAAQPVRTTGGFAVYQGTGTPTNIFVSVPEYSLTVRDENDALVYTARTVVLSLESKLALGTGTNNIGYTSGGISSVTNTLTTKLKEIRSSVDFGGTQDAIDSSAAIIAEANDAVVNGRKVVMIPPNTKFDYATVMAGAPTGITFINFSGINDFSSGGGTTRVVGFMGTSVAVNDLHVEIADAHHPTVTWNNLGTAGSTSAANRLASALWAAGKFALGASTARGFRGCAILQFRKESSTTWSYGLRSLAPWLSIAGQYEAWATGQSIASANVYRVNGSNHYVSAAGSYPATTGGSAPVHTSGTVSDGGVSWTWLDSSDRGIFLIDQYGHLLIGNGALNVTLRHKVTPTDPTQAYVGELVAGGISQSSNLKLTPTDSGGSEVAKPFFQATSASGLSVVKSDGSSSLMNITDGGVVVGANGATVGVVDTATGATPNVSGKNTYYIGNAGAQSITGFTGGFDGQRLRVIVTNANTSFTNSATFQLHGSANITTPAAFSVLDFEKVPTSISDRWIMTGPPGLK
jgi:hypothetical protein